MTYYKPGSDVLRTIREASEPTTLHVLVAMRIDEDDTHQTQVATFATQALAIEALDDAIDLVREHVTDQLQTKTECIIWMRDGSRVHFSIRSVKL